MPKKEIKKHLFDHLWDVWCIVSVVGIWPRFIEPQLLKTTHLSLPIRDLPEDLKGLKILQFSDLHLHRDVPDRFLEKILKKVNSLEPDLIVFTGDFLCNAQMQEEERLLKFLNSFHAPYGCYAIVGNHDYEDTISVNERGEYDIVDARSADIVKGFKRLFSTIHLIKQTTERAKQLQVHQGLIDLLKKTPFTLLKNQSELLSIGNSHLNICGLGEYMLADHNLEKTFQNYDRKYPGLILAHNPDTAPQLSNYPGDVILCGHTHGSQVNLPYIRTKFVVLENKNLTKGLHQLKDKWVYVNRGVGSTFPFRWFSTPELMLLTLEPKNEV